MKTAFVSSIKYLVLALLIFVFLVSAKSVNAQDSNQTPSQYLTPNTNSDVPNNLHTWTQNVMLEVMSAMGCQLTGIDVATKDHRCLGTDPQTGKIGYVDVGKGGILGFVSNSIVTLYTPPAGSGDYVRYLAGSFGIAKPALAQNTSTPGYGVTSLAPLTKLWVVFRNFVYLMYVLVFIVIGLAIMFRVKIDPRTVMSIQNQIPKIIVSLILVTFSFAIAGFLIDLMYAISYILVGLIASADTNFSKDLITPLIGATNPLNALNTIANNNSIFSGDVSGIAKISQGAADAVGTHLGDLFDNLTGRAITSVVGGIIGSVLVGSTSILGFSVGIAGLFLGAIAGPAILGSILSVVAFLVIVVTIIAALFRLWFQLIMAYVNILIDIIFAPIWILAGLVPGSKINFSAWLRDIIANLSAFPIVLVMFALARVFMDAFGARTSYNTFTPPLIGNPASNQQIAALITLGFILITPSVVKLMKSMLKAPGTGFGPIMESVTGGVKIGTTLGRPILNKMYSTNRVTGHKEGALVDLGKSIQTRAGHSPVGTINSGLTRVKGAITRPFRRRPSTPAPVPPPPTPTPPTGGGGPAGGRPIP